MAEQRGLLKALENWAKKVTTGYRGVNVNNLSSSFRDGLAFCAIIHHYYPELIDFDSLSSENILYNNSLAFSIAEKKLGVPALLDAEDMVTYAVPDRLSIATYLSQLRNCFENQNRVNKVRPAVKRVLKEGQSGPPAKFLGESRNSTPKSHELCQVCKHRVFLLERLMVSGKLYHRTCFKCSRCDTLLKPGAYVESDVTGKYECAICPRDERKEPEPKVAPDSTLHVDREMSNGMSLSNGSTPSPSPLGTPKLPVLSTKVNSARKSFLQKSIDEKLQQEKDDKVSSSSKSSSSSSIESLSRTSDHPAFDDSPQNLDSGFKDGSASEDLPSEVPKTPAQQTETTDLKTPVRPLRLKIDPEPSNVHRPYQSIFTRELLHTTSLKSLSSAGVSPRPDVTSPTSLKPLPSTRLTTDIPLIRSTSYTTASLPRHSLNKTSPKESTASTASLETESSHSDTHASDISNHKWSSNLRRSSLDTNHEDTGDNVKARHYSDLNLSADLKSPNSKLPSDVTYRFPEVRTCRIEQPSEEFVSTTSVKQLIRQREASIRDSRLSISAYKRDSKIDVRNKEGENGHDVASPALPKEDITVSAETAQDSPSVVIKSDEIVPVERESPDRLTAMQHKRDDIMEDKEEVLPVVADSDVLDSSEPKILEKASAEPEIKKDADDAIKYPDDLNPFGEEEEDEASQLYPDSLNPFGDDEDGDEAKPHVPVSSSYDESKNPFASDDDEDDAVKSPQPVTRIPVRPPVPIVKTPVQPKPVPCQQTLPRLNSSESPTGSIKGTLKKRQAPRAPHVKELFLDTSRGSETSLSTLDMSPSPVRPSPSPKMRKGKRAPPPPSPAIGANGQVDSGKRAKDTNNVRLKAGAPPKEPDQKSVSSEGSSVSSWKGKKRPAPPVPIPRRREIKKIPLHEIKKEMNEIEEKQMDLEKHGRDLEVMIRDRDKDEEPTVEEEECILQLFELVNQKNALFRRQAELMYIKRSQRLEEEQVELEFQIRCLIDKPKSQRTDDDKAREEKLLQQLLDVVDQRNEIIDSIEMDRRREAEEDVSVQEQMEIKSGDLPITAEIKQKSEKKHKDKKKKKKKKSKDEGETDDKKGPPKKKWF